MPNPLNPQGPSPTPGANTSDWITENATFTLSDPFAITPTEPPLTPLPEGPTWHLAPTPGSRSGWVKPAEENAGITAYAEGFARLAIWMRENRLIGLPYSYGIQRSEATPARAAQSFRLPLVIEVVPSHYYGDTNVGLEMDITFCPEPSCQLPTTPGVPYCLSCGQEHVCGRCDRWATRWPLSIDADGEYGVLCGNCSYSCQTCGARSEFEVCAAHASGERFHCVNCGTYTDDGAGASYSDYHDGIVCENCLPEFCVECDVESSRLYDGLCAECSERDERVAFNTANGTEEFEEEEKLEREMFVNSIPGRENIRNCGIEIEGGGNHRALGQNLYTAGLVHSPNLGEYHQMTSHGPRDGLWSLERDGSVDWELVSPPINLAETAHVRSLRNALKIVRDEIKAGNVSLDMRCGLHVHIGAERTAIGGAYNLGTLWGYLEDVFFRLGAAKWPKHRAIVNGIHYCRPTQKGAKTRLEFGLQLESQSEARYNALSFNNYIRAMSRSCICGAVRYDSWDQCVCDLGKCTFEFRVFNTSANMHKIHAYLALCQALVAHATSLPDLDASLFPAQTFQAIMVDDMGGTVRELHTEAWKPRLEFLFNELPLTDPEKADLLYCVRSSELSALGGEFIDSLAPNNAQEVLV